MSRKLAAAIGTATAVLLLAGGLVAVTLGRSAPPKPVVASSSTPSSAAPATTPTTSPVSTHTPGRRSGEPVADPTAALVAGNRNVLFLSFDDGPDPVWTPRILQVLRKHGAHATFFQLGTMQAQYPALRAQILAEGNTIGSHSISHPQLTALSAARRHHEIFGGPRSKCFRPPYGATNPKVRAEIKAAGMAEVLWDIDPRDWAKPGATKIVNNILHHAHRHNIILLHDGGGVRAQTVAALDRVLPLLKARGFSFPAMNC
ncbi:polysaccharide deacetylase [Kribbella flavida DSM 17836]|uniref:Polysaccharide deacetylase n=1 Tax=Kribbella flavida (strain DSM 17836 / JCM 10339 / NBRC 14399) TaxID=479435 RepID=D2PN94_KRIFD|nr:polysaccharide deacetylase family protein [Kribbella flavida]ADB34578.1 polysaccharide deacetylase [Kribbella flavida DSM 17836]